MPSLRVIFSRLRPEYVARVGSAPYDSRTRTTSRWSFSTASWMGLNTRTMMHRQRLHGIRGGLVRNYSMCH